MENRTHWSSWSCPKPTELGNTEGYITLVGGIEASSTSTSVARIMLSSSKIVLEKCERYLTLPPSIAPLYRGGLEISLNFCNLSIITNERLWVELMLNGKEFD